MPGKIPIRRFRRPTNRKTREPFTLRFGRWAAVLLKNFLRAAAVFSIAFSGWWLYEELLMSPYLKINAINVHGSKRISVDEVLKLSGVYVGKNILTVRRRQVESSVKTNPFVEDVVLRRRLPDAVDIEIAEREPVALVKLNGLFVMDRNGSLFKEYHAGDGLDLPVITVAEGMKKGWEEGIKASLMGFMEILRHEERFNLDNTSEIQVDGTYGFSVVTLKEGIRLEFGKSNFERKVTNLKKVVRARGGDLSGVTGIDLNGDRGVVVRFFGPAVKGGGIT